MRKITALMVFLTVFCALLTINPAPLCAEVVNSTTPANGEWDFKLEKEWDVFNVNDDVLVNLRAIQVDQQGKIYVFDSKLFKFYVFSPQGKLLNSFGKRGEGPGELKHVGRFYLLGKHLIVPDGGKMHFFSLEGKFVKSINLGGFFFPKAFVDENRFVTIKAMPDKKAKVEKLEMFDMRTKERSLLAEVSAQKVLTASSGGMQLAFIDSETTPAVLVGSDGKSLWFGKNDQYKIKQTDLTGKELNSFSMKGKEPPKITAQMKKDRFNNMSLNGGKMPQEMIKQMVKQMPDHSTHFQLISIDDSGMIYIFLTDVSNETGWEIDIFSPGGKYLYHSKITLPDGLKPVDSRIAIKGNSLVTFVEDEEGERKLVKYKITKPSI